MTAATDFELCRDVFGRLTLTVDGQQYTGVAPVRAFPVSAAQGPLSLVDADGRELAWVPDLAALDAPRRALIEAALQTREFMPVIQCLLSVSSFSTPSAWDVETDRGRTQLTLKGEEDIRRLSANVMLIADAQGVQYLIRDVQDMDRHSRKLLDRFL
ncbi:MAG: DUF1854 domain-containing protein [Burkholderiaceae bacterium]|jgi:hypothetical protein|nr:DUF1854 domain-containing protein [Burkholderiaceae bacterium]